jgi:hypothetical protein
VGYGKTCKAVRAGGKNMNKNMDKHFDFNKIYVIESLKSTDKKTGKQLYDDLLSRKVYSIPELECEYIYVNSKNEFTDAMEKIKNETQNNGKYPYIHFEIHGYTRKIKNFRNGYSQMGLAIINSKDDSGECLNWKELSGYLREINILTKNNLVISLAVCFGADIFGAIDCTKEAPFWGYVGCWYELKNEQLIYEAFYNYFDTLLQKTDFHKAVEELNKVILNYNNENNCQLKGYIFRNAEEVFEQVWNDVECKYSKNYTQGLLTNKKTAFKKKFLMV